MSFLRILIRVPLLLLWSIGCTIFCHVFNHGAKASQRSLELTLMWAKVAAWLCNLKVQVKGNADIKGGLIASNHQGVLDILVLAVIFKIRFAPKTEIRKWPILGWLVWCNRPVWIDRSTPRKAKKTAEAMSETMRNGQAMLVFPEGTTSDGENGLLPFKSTAFQAAIDAGQQVIPVIISYAPEIRSRVQYCGTTTFLQHIRSILGLKESRVTVYIMEGVMPDAFQDRKDLAAGVYNIMDGKWRTL